MNSDSKENNSLLFNFITLLGLVGGFFLIMFLKRGEGKKSEQLGKKYKSERNRVKNSPQTEITEKPEEKELPLEDLNLRQRKILERLVQEGSMDPAEIYSLAPDVSTRTIRRDMDRLVGLGLVSQKGTTKSTQYIFTGK